MSAPTNISHSQFGDHTIIHQGNVQGNVYYGTQPHPPARAEVVRVIPYPRNEDLVHRRDLIDKLDELLPQTTSGSYSAALWGLGGSGKTQIALDYAYRRCDADKECSIFWVHADSEATFLADYKTIGKKLGVDQRLDGTDLLDAVRNKIEEQSKWLMILDNADELKLFGVGQQQEGTENQDFREYVPSQGTVLWTSRDAHIGGTLVGASRSIQVQSMAMDEATILLATTRGDLPIAVGDGVDRLLEELQCLPLAVSQAGTYMRRMSMTAEEYLSLLKQGKSRWEVLKVSDTDRHRRPEVSNSVLETWRISTERIRAESEMSYRILHVIAYVDSQDIPHELIAAAAKLPTHGSKDAQFEKSSAVQVTELEVLAAVARLMEFSYLRLRQTEDGERSYEMHKLVREALQYGLRIHSSIDKVMGRLLGDDQEAPHAEALYSRRALLVVDDLFPIFEQALWARCDQYLTHAIRVGEWAEISGTEIETARLFERVSYFLHDRGRWREKESVDSRAWDLRREVLGEKHPDTISSLEGLGVTYFGQGQYAKAQEIAIKVLGFRQEVLGTHPDTIRAISDLGATYLGQGRYDEAKKLQDEALRLRQEMLGEKHPDTISSMACIGQIYQTLGQYKEAQDIAIQVLELRQEVLGKHHPHTIMSMANLGVTYQTQGRYEEAYDLATKVLQLRKEVLGEKHPDATRTMADLGTIHHAQGQYEEAEKLHTEVLELRQETLGDRHPDTIISMASVAVIYHQQGQYSKALELHQTTLDLRRQVLGEDHPDTMQSVANVASTYHQLGQYSKSLELHQSNLDSRRKVLGENHPDTIQSVAYVASTREMIQYLEAFTSLAIKPFGYGTPERSSDLSKADLVRSRLAIRMRQPWKFDKTQSWVPPKLKEFSPTRVPQDRQVALAPGRRSLLARALTDSEASQYSSVDDISDKAQWDSILINIENTFAEKGRRDVRVHMEHGELIGPTGNLFRMYQPGPALLGPQIENLSDTVLRHHGLLESDSESCAEAYMAGHPDRPETFEPTVTFDESTSYITRELMATVTKLKKPHATGTTLGNIMGVQEEDSNSALPVPAEDDAEPTERKGNKFSEHMKNVDDASNFRLRAVLMGQLSDKARRASRWPLLSPVRCNRIIPVFQSHAADIKSFNFKSAIPGASTYTVRKKMIRDIDGSQLVLLFIEKEICEALRLHKQMKAFLVFEIMHEGKSRDIPWVPCPSVGPYDNFECALRPSNWSKLMEANNTRDIIRQYQVPKDDEGFHREPAAQQQYLNELSQTDPSERIDWPRPVIPQPHDVLNYFFEQSFDERIALKDYMKAATEFKLLPIFGATRQGGHIPPEMFILFHAVQLLLFGRTGAHDQTRTGSFPIGFPEPAAGDHPVLGDYSADDLFRAIVLMYVLMEQRMRPEAPSFASTPRPEHRGQQDMVFPIIRLPKELQLRIIELAIGPPRTAPKTSDEHFVDEGPPELRFRAVLSTSEDMTTPLKLSCCHIFDMIRKLRPVEAIPYDRFLLGEGPLFRINLDRDMLRIFDNAPPRYRSNDGYRAAILAQRILSYIHNMPTVVFRTTSNPGDPNDIGNPNNTIRPFHPSNPIDPDDDDFLDDLYGDDHLWIIPGLKRLGPSFEDDDEHEQRGLQAHTAIKWQFNFHRYYDRGDLTVLPQRGQYGRPIGAPRNFWEGDNWRIIPYACFFGHDHGRTYWGGAWSGFRYFEETQTVYFKPLTWTEVEPLVTGPYGENGEETAFDDHHPQLVARVTSLNFEHEKSPKLEKPEAGPWPLALAPATAPASSPKTTVPLETLEPSRRILSRRAGKIRTTSNEPSQPRETEYTSWAFITTMASKNIFDVILTPGAEIEKPTKQDYERQGDLEQGGYQSSSRVVPCYVLAPSPLSLDWSFNGENVCRLVGSPAFRKDYSNRRTVGEYLNSFSHAKIETRYRNAATGAYEPGPPFPNFDVFEQEATLILFKQPGSYGNTNPDSHVDSVEQFDATDVGGTDKHVQTPPNVSDDEESDTSSGSVEVDLVDARSDHSQSQAELDEKCDGTAATSTTKGARTLESLSDGGSDASSSSVEVDLVDSSSDHSATHMDLDSGDD
ncbi:unnamed protein product [Fusarium equiseti]|uniref:AAA+ ATPase domain-containing protein n=1 Tax=Fusarium equiseti TaxID=61235 RepID=A0A8J2IRL8_FUSEQ|nr:unnamed protein product [Fusarium equiseti]